VRDKSTVTIGQGLQLRAATADDRTFLYDLHRVAMHDYVDATWGWTESDQQERFDRRFDPSLVRIVVLEWRDIGALTVTRMPLELVLGNIEILPAFQGRGIGTRVVQALLAEANTKQLPLTLQVLKANPRARSLYERLGFRRVSETTTHDLMRG
jgi:putative acetyltransferase